MLRERKLFPMGYVTLVQLSSGIVWRWYSNHVRESQPGPFRSTLRDSSLLLDTLFNSKVQGRERLHRFDVRSQFFLSLQFIVRGKEIQLPLGRADKNKITNERSKGTAITTTTLLFLFFLFSFSFALLSSLFFLFFFPLLIPVRPYPHLPYSSPSLPSLFIFVFSSWSASSLLFSRCSILYPPLLQTFSLNDNKPLPTCLIPPISIAPPQTIIIPTRLIFF